MSHIRTIVGPRWRASPRHRNAPAGLIAPLSADPNSAEVKRVARAGRRRTLLNSIARAGVAAGVAFGPPLDLFPMTALRARMPLLAKRGAAGPGWFLRRQLREAEALQAGPWAERQGPRPGIGFARRRDACRNRRAHRGARAVGRPARRRDVPVPVARGATGARGSNCAASERADRRGRRCAAFSLPGRHRVGRIRRRRPGGGPRRGGPSRGRCGHSRSRGSATDRPEPDPRLAGATGPASAAAHGGMAQSTVASRR
jgi:hypothetical protein